MPAMYEFLRGGDSWTDYTLNVPKSVWSVRQLLEIALLLDYQSSSMSQNFVPKTYDENRSIETVEEIS